MEGFHYEVGTNREDLTKTIARQLGNIIDAGMQQETNGVIVTFRHPDGISAGYVGDKNEYLFTAVETLAMAIGRENECEHDAKRMEWIRHKLHTTAMNIIMSDFLVGDVFKI